MSTVLKKGRYVPLIEYARRKNVPYGRLYMAVRQGRAPFDHYKVGRAHLVRVA